MSEIRLLLKRLEPVLSGVEATVGRSQDDIAAIQRDVAWVRSEVKDLVTSGTKMREDIAELKGRVSQLPSTVQLIGFVLAVLAFGGVLRLLHL